MSVDFSRNIGGMVNWGLYVGFRRSGSALRVRATICIYCALERVFAKNNRRGSVGYRPSSSLGIPLAHA